MESCELGGDDCFPISCGVYGLCLHVQVLRFSCTGCTQYTCGFCPPTLLDLAMSRYGFLLLSALRVRLCGGEEQLLQFL